MTNPLTRSLVRFGFSEKEAKVYLALLEFGTASVSETARKASINRSSTYVVLESLKSQGFVGLSSNSEGLQQYIASPPEIILRLATEKVKEEQIAEDGIKEIFPELKALHKETRHKPTVRIFEGKAATEEAYYNTRLLKTAPDVKEIRVYEDLGQYLKNLPGFIERDHSERKRLGLKMYNIYPETKAAGEILGRLKSLGSKDDFAKIPENKFIPSKRFINLTIVGDEVWFDSLRESYCINIKNQEIADTLKNLFDLAFERAKELGEGSKKVRGKKSGTSS